MEGQTSDLRDYNRFDYKHPLTCLIMGDMARLPEKATFAATIVDVSSSGLGIYVENELTRGAVMLVRIPVAGTEANVRTFAIEAPGRAVRRLSPEVFDRLFPADPVCFEPHPIQSAN